MILSDATYHLVDLAKTVLDDPEPDFFLSHLVNKTLASLEARRVMVGVIEREGFLDLRGVYGYPDSAMQPSKRIPLWTPTPITDAARKSEITIFKSPQELQLSYPHVNEPESSQIFVKVSAPVTYRNTIIGAISFDSLLAPFDGFESHDVTQGILALCGLYLRNEVTRNKSEDRGHTSAVKSLTLRQKKVIQLFQDALTTDQMAERLNFSSSTIKQDIIKIYSIFGVNNRQAVIELARTVNLI